MYISFLIIPLFLTISIPRIISGFILSIDYCPNIDILIYCKYCLIHNKRSFILFFNNIYSY